MKNKRRTSCRTFHQRRLQFEPLEQRALLDASGVGSLRVTGGQYVSVPSHPLLDTPVLESTIEAWVRTDTAHSDCQTVITKGYAGSYWLGLCNDRLTYRTGGASYVGNTTIPVNTWTHIAAVRTATTVQLFVNGQSDGLTSGTTLIPLIFPNTLSVTIGRETPGSIPNLSYELDGRIGEVRIWYAARSAGEIRAEAHEAIEGPRPGLIASWPLKQDALDEVAGYAGEFRANAAISSVDSPPKPERMAFDTNFNVLATDRNSATEVRLDWLPSSALLIGGNKGGSLSGAIDVIDLASGDVETLTAFPNSIRLHRTAAAMSPLTQSVFTFGGETSASQLLDTIYEINVANGTTTQLPIALPYPVADATAVYHPGTSMIYIMGGTVNGALVDSILVFDPQTRTIVGSLPATLPEPRALANSIYSRATGKLYVFGGSIPLPMQNAATNIYELTLGQNGSNASWRTLVTQLPAQLLNARAVIDPHTSLIYLAADHGRRLEVLDPVLDQQWTTKVAFTSIGADFSFLFDPTNRHALVVGGTLGARKVWRIPLGTGPNIPVGEWDIPASVAASSTISDIDGDESVVLIGTLTDGAWRYEADSQRHHYTAANLGSSSGRVDEVLYDSRNGSSYIGTSDAGLKRDTGTSLVNIGIGADMVLSLDHSTNSALAPLVGTNVGLKRFITVPAPGFDTSFTGQGIAAIDHRVVGEAWILSNSQLRRHAYVPDVNSDSETSLGNPCGLNYTSAASQLAFGIHQDLWATTEGDPEFLGGGVCYMARGATPNVATAVNIQDFPASGVDIDADGRAWIGADSIAGQGGLWQYSSDGQTVTRSEQFNWLNSPIGSRSLATGGAAWQSRVTAVAAVDERIWVGQPNGRLATYAPRWKQLESSLDIDEFQSINDLWPVRGRLFVDARATTGGSTNLYVLMPDALTWDVRQGVNSEVVFADSHGNTWIGTTAGPRWYLAEGWDMLTDRGDARPTGTVNSIVEDQHGRIWLGGANGLTLYDRGRFVTTWNSSNSPLPGNNIASLLVDRDNRLWIGTSNNGIAVLDSEEWTIYDTADGLLAPSIRDLVALPGGHIAIGTSVGVNLYDPATGFSNITPPISEASPDLTVDGQGRLWAGNAVRSVSGQWQVYYEANSGLPSEIVSDVAADGGQFVWFTHGIDGGITVRGDFIAPPSMTVPQITSPTTAARAQGSSGDRVTIQGSGFGLNREDIAVAIGGTAVTVISVVNDRIVVEIGDETVSGDVTVSRGGQRTTSRDAFRAIPVISTFTPTGGNVGVLVTVTGTNFDPGAELYLGSTLVHAGARQSATQMSAIIAATDGNATNRRVRVVNRVSGATPTFTDESSTNFQRIDLNLERIVLNQGVQTVSMIAGRQTVIQNYISRLQTPRLTDRIEIDTIEVTFIEEGRVSEPVLIDVCAGPSNAGFCDNPLMNLLPGRPPQGIELDDLAYSVNGVVTPRIRGADSPTTVEVRLLRRGQVIDTGQQQDSFNPPARATVLLVPIMPNDGTYSDVLALRNSVNGNMSEFSTRIFPGTLMNYAWSDFSYTVDDVLIGSASTIQLDSVAELYDASHSLDRARRAWNDSRLDRATYVIGVVDDRVVEDTGVSGFAFWTNVSEVINLLALDLIDTLCDIGDKFVEVFTLGAVGGDGCNLEIPKHVGWVTSGVISATAGSYPIGHIIAHELGHTMGLVQFGYNQAGDNISHSENDELTGGECDNDGVRFSRLHTYYAQPGIVGPIVNPYRADLQLRPMFDVENPSGADRAKALMSYACNVTNSNTFFEPVDLEWIDVSLAVTNAVSFTRGLLPSQTAASTRGENTHDERSAPTPAVPPPAGQLPLNRVYVSGTVDRDGSSGTIRRVEQRSPSAPHDLSYATGFSLVQLDAQNRELARTGIYPGFRTSEMPAGVSELSVGFFATTLVAEAGLARLELRHDDQLLDVFDAGPANPIVQILAPTGGTFVQGSVTLSWTVSDPDDDASELEVILEYSPDNGQTWSPIGFAQGGGSRQIPVDQLSGSSAARFRVRASDGFHDGEAVSAAFQVANKASRPFVSSPASDTRLLESQWITLQGGADDTRDGFLTGERLQWMSDRDGLLGQGETIVTRLSVGAHQITLTSTNSAGLQASKTVALNVLGDYDHDSISDVEERAMGMDPLSARDAYSDLDDDGVLLVVELAYGTDPNLRDSDGDGRNDDLEIMDRTDPLLVDAPRPADTLVVSPSAITMNADFTERDALPQEFVSVVSDRPADWRLTADVDWLAVSQNTGTTVAGVTVLADAFKLSDGTHTGTLTFTSQSLGQSIRVPVTLNITNLEGYFDTTGDGQFTEEDRQAIGACATGQSDDCSWLHDVDRDGTFDTDDADWADAVVRYRGDLNQDGTVDATDIDLWCRGNVSPSVRDLDNNDQADMRDFDFLIRTILGTDYGDTNLDRRIDAIDFDQWSANRFRIGTGWATGNFNCDPVTDVLDFNLWNRVKFTVTIGEASSGTQVTKAVARAALATRDHAVAVATDRPLAATAFQQPQHRRAVHSYGNVARRRTDQIDAVFSQWSDVPVVLVSLNQHRSTRTNKQYA